ncbi:hypothetical protein RI129_002322 [Pyrocoelia pectoralis]|uniref:DUF4806 domain-containing protein n=1 Tax=Pyrocoelia pectoralis TaxID=417401 RepID=A0AAN7VFS9_9COLE
MEDEHINDYEGELKKTNSCSETTFILKTSRIDKLLSHRNRFYVKFISTIGGREVKDNIHRCLKTLFTNDIATKCSWLGQRGNFPLRLT